MSKFATKRTIEDRLYIASDHMHGEANVYPTGAGGVQVTGAAGAWTLGAYAEIVPASTIGIDFDIHWVTIEAAGAPDVYEVVLYRATTEIARFRVAILDIANARILPAIPIMTPLIDADSQIQAKVMSAGGGSDAITLSIGYHTY